MLAYLVFVLAALPTCVTASVELEGLIAATARAVGGVEVCQYRMYDAISDLDGDKKPDFVVVFTVEGAEAGPRSMQYLAVFGSATEKPVVVEVARVGQRVAESLEVDSPDIVLHVKEYSDSDAVCCPSDPVLISYRLACGGLEQVMHSSKKLHEHAKPLSPCEGSGGSQHP